MIDLRNYFFLPDDPDAIELRALTHGLMPRTVPGMMTRFTDDWRRLGVDAWNHVPNHWRPKTGDAVGWWTLPEYLGDEFIAPMLGAERGSCILLPNVHWIVQAILSCPDLGLQGRKVVTTQLEFPSVLHTLQRWQSVYGFEIVAVPASADGFVDQEVVLAAIDETTALVVLSHVGFTTSERLSDAFLRDVCLRAHRAGALVAIDGYHATGSIDVDVAGAEVDLYFGGLLKEGCGSSGNAYVYVRPGVELSPRASGWFGDADPFGFELEPADHQSIRRRFMGGTPPIAPLYHAVEGLRILLDAGLQNVRRDSVAKTQRCIERADDLGLQLRSPRDADRRGAMVIIEVDAADLLCEYLKTEGVFTDSRRSRYVRLSPFVWNTMDEVDRAFDVIAQTLASGQHLRLDLAKQPGPVT